MKLPLALVALVAALALPPPALSASESDDGARAEIRKVTDSLLQRFYAARPRLGPEVRGAAGFAVFTTYSGNLIGTPGGGGGKGVGVARKGRDGAETFMAMAQTSPDAKAVLEREILIVFTSQKAFDEFAMRGWKAGNPGNEPADAKVYSFSKDTVETGASLAGARFWNHSALN
jgi:hypothetical protein